MYTLEKESWRAGVGLGGDRERISLGISILAQDLTLPWISMAVYTSLVMRYLANFYFFFNF